MDFAMPDFDNPSSAVAVSPHSNFKAPLPPYTRSSGTSSSTSTLPPFSKSSPASSSESFTDNVSMDGIASGSDGQSVDSDGSHEVQWQSSQASSALESLLVRASSKSRRTAGSAGKGSGSHTPSRLSMGSTASSSSSTSPPGGSSFVWPVTGNLDANATSTMAPPFLRRQRPSALSSTCRKSNLLSSSTASSSSSSTKGGAIPSKKEDITESFKLFVKQVTSKVDENLAHSTSNTIPAAIATADASSSTSTTGLSRTNSRNTLLYGGITRHHSKSGKPLSASGVASAAAASGLTTAGRRPLQGRTLSANAIFSGTGGREHRVGGDDCDVRGKGKARELTLGRGADDMDVDVDTPATAWKVPQVPAGSTTTSNGIGNASVVPSRNADSYTMPPPALPPEHLQGSGRVQSNGVVQNPAEQQPIVPAISVIPSSQQSIQDLGVPIPASSQHQQQPFKPPLSQTSHETSAPAPASGAFHATSTTTAATTKVTTPAPTTHLPNVPAAPIATTIRSGKPPPLGMRRAHTFSSASQSTGSNNAYSAFGLGSQQQLLSSQSNSSNNNRYSNGLPMKQRAFKAPSFQKPPQPQPPAQVQLQAQLPAQPQPQVHQGVTAMNGLTTTTTTPNAPSTAFSRASSSASSPVNSSSVFKPSQSGFSNDNNSGNGTSLDVPTAVAPNAYDKIQITAPVGVTTAPATNQNQNHRQARFKPPTPTFAPGAIGASTTANSNSNSGNACAGVAAASGSTGSSTISGSGSSFGLARSKSSDSTASSGSNNSIQSLGFSSRFGTSSSGTSVNSGLGQEKRHGDEEEEAEGEREDDGEDTMLVESFEDPDSSYGDISFDLDELEDVCSKYD